MGNPSIPKITRHLFVSLRSARNDALRTCSRFSNLVSDEFSPCRKRIPFRKTNKHEY